MKNLCLIALVLFIVTLHSPLAAADLKLLITAEDTYESVKSAEKPLMEMEQYQDKVLYYKKDLLDQSTVTSYSFGRFTKTISHSFRFKCDEAAQIGPFIAKFIKALAAETPPAQALPVPPDQSLMVCKGGLTDDYRDRRIYKDEKLAADLNSSMKLTVDEHKEMEKPDIALIVNFSYSLADHAAAAAAK